MYLTGERIKLRAPEPTDLDLMYGVENDTSLWSVGMGVTPYSRHLLQLFIEESAHDLFIDRQLRMMIVDKETEEVLGMVDLSDFDPMHRRAAVGVLVLPAYRNKGIATEAVSLLTTYSFQLLQLHQLYAYIPVTNGASKAVFEKSGFIQSSCLIDWLSTAEGFIDVFFLQIINR
ncbi:MAG: GNAT family N-acetyltransferase [Bacteroidaceae bacterium]|nr:GNAT family N-acetyltransferase [Bacteroidaceae bacterium]